MRIAVCDDEKLYTDLIEKAIKITLDEMNFSYEIEKFVSSSELFERLKENSFDALFLDIDMPKISGFEISALIRENETPSQIIFVSVYDKLVYESFDYTPLFFVCKKGNFEKDLNRAILKLTERYKNFSKITIKDSATGPVSLCADDIVYVTSDKHYIEYHTSKNKQPFYERNTLNEVEYNLPQAFFIRVHQRYIVNMIHIEKLDYYGNRIIMKNNKTVPISTPFKDGILIKYMQYKRK